MSDSDTILIGRESLMSQRQPEELLRAFELFGSPECVAAATPFLCVYLFGGLCDEDGTHYLPTASECEEISTGICQREWELAHSIGMEIVNCDLLPSDTPAMCSISNVGAGGNSSITNGDDRDDENDDDGKFFSGLEIPYFYYIKKQRSI